jgi:micrococcal nuclease
LFTLVSLAYFSWVYIYPKLIEHDTRQSEYHYVKKVTDGDTFELENGEKVRLLGIDAPEKFESQKLNSDAERSGRDKKTIQKLGQLSSQFARELLDGKKVRLVPEPDYEDKDKYGRLLRYVYLEDGTFVNKKIVEEGYAYAYRKFPVTKLDELIEAERRARTQKTGLWGSVDGLKQLNEK